MKRILGLDLGTNSIGWAVINSENDGNNDILKNIEAADSRIIPMDASALSDFAKGNTVSQTKDRTFHRGARRILERHLLRRERLHRILDLLGFLPKHYADSIDRYGKFKENIECKLPWRVTDDGTYEFIFKNSYNEMLDDFKRVQTEWLGNGGCVPYDWTIYYLRKKALHEAITKQELAWILLNFNRKRGYYQLRGEDEDTASSDKLVEYYALKVVSVEDAGEKPRGKEKWFNITLENGFVYRRTATIAPDWVGKTKDFIVTTDLDKNGKPKFDKEGNIKCSFRMPNENDWTLVMKKTEADIDKSGKDIGEYIYDHLLDNPTMKVRGGLVKHVERIYYKQELKHILEKQKQYIHELNDRELYAQCINELYGSNEAFRNSIAGRDFTYLFMDDIIFYQRPLKSKKSLIANCPYENNSYIDKNTGETNIAPIKCIAKSNPLFQEFRLWQFVQNLRIYERQKSINGTLHTDVDITSEIFTSEADRVRLFDFLNDRKEIKQDVLFGTYFKCKK